MSEKTQDALDQEYSKTFNFRDELDWEMQDYLDQQYGKRFNVGDEVIVCVRKLSASPANRQTETAYSYGTVVWKRDWMLRVDCQGHSLRNWVPAELKRRKHGLFYAPDIAALWLASDEEKLELRSLGESIVQETKAIAISTT